MVTNSTMEGISTVKVRNEVWTKTRFGNLLSKDWGASSPAGTCYLFISNQLRHTREFKTKKERQLIFRMWNQQYNPKYYEDMFIEVKYCFLNDHQRKVSREAYKASVQSAKHFT
jgi:hypothetical protein